MAYTDPTDVRVALTPGGDDADVGTAAYLSDADLNAAIADATGEVNIALAGRYTVPFADPAPDVIKTITTDIAGYLATLTARGGDPLDARDPVAIRNARAVRLLGQLQTGAALLSGSSPAAAGNELMPLGDDDPYLYHYGLPSPWGGPYYIEV